MRLWSLKTSHKDPPEMCLQTLATCLVPCSINIALHHLPLAATRVLNEALAAFPVALKVSFHITGGNMAPCSTPHAY